jgi:hypothetical protein
MGEEPSRRCGIRLRQFLASHRHAPQDGLAQRRQRDTASATLHERRAEGVFKCLQRHRDCRLGDVQPLGHALERSGLRDVFEQQQVPDTQLLKARRQIRHKLN